VQRANFSAEWPLRLLEMQPRPPERQCGRDSGSARCDTVVRTLPQKLAEL